MILDTAFFIDLLRNDASALSKAKNLELSEESLAAASITVFELWRGFGLLDKRKMERACEMLEQLRIFPLDAKSAKVAGRIANELDSIGKEIDPEDSMIAGIALLNNEVLLTRNEKHFSRIKTLKIESY